MENVATEKSAKTLTTVIYALYAASFLVGITAIVAIVMNYVKKDDVAGTFLESHFRWQIRTFWFGLLWGVLGAITFLIAIGGGSCHKADGSGVLGAITFLIAIGVFVFIADGIWIIYRIVKGWLRLNDNKPMYTA